MSRRKKPGHLFRNAEEDRKYSHQLKAPEASRAQVNSPSYRLAYDDLEFLTREELRPLRLQLELTKPDMILRDEGIEHTVVVFGSARSPDMGTARGELASCQEAMESVPDSPALQQRYRNELAGIRHAGYYEKSRALARIISERSGCDDCPALHVVTGGGPGIMQAANQGATEVGSKSIGLNIVLPHEQFPNPYTTPELSFQFHYFAIRKMHFLLRARALVVFPGGFGTLDELFETLTLIQTGKVEPMPIILFGEEYWKDLINFELMVEEGMISAQDLDLFQYVDEPEVAWEIIRQSLDYP